MAFANRFGGSCRRCGEYVQVGGGVCEKVEGRWVTRHSGRTCPATVAQPAAVQAPEQDAETGHEIAAGAVVAGAPVTSGTVLVTGNTYPVRDQMRAWGARWNAGAQGWDVPAARAAEAQVLVAAQGPAKPRRAKRTSGDRDYAKARREYERTGDYYGSGLYDEES